MTRNEQTAPPTAQSMVEEFHRLFSIVVHQTPTVIDEQTRILRERLIHEEFEELKEAMAKNDLFAVAKELADLLYVVYGTAVSYGIDMEPVFREVHRSNMSKIGGYKREDGKWVKPATYSPAVIEPILIEQQSREHEDSPLSELRNAVRSRRASIGDGGACAASPECGSVPLSTLHEQVSCL
jgi:predicted HAD superfamily Cof-like phosphohydrolase